MKLLILLVLGVNVLVCLCFVKPNIQRKPRPVKKFISEKATGKWYYIGKIISCKFQGVRDFQDHSRINVLDESGKLYKTRQDYRVGPKCYSLDDVRILQEDNCAVQFVKDRIGGLYSGERIIVAVDYKRFMIEWGCLQYDQNDSTFCLDNVIDVLARVPDPSSRTRFIIDAILKKMFNSVLADMDNTKHKNPC